MKKRYLLRLDDACPTMHAGRWTRVESILDKYGIRPMVGIVPDNRDEKLMQSPVDPDFWLKAKARQAKGWTIALHGLHHTYHKCAGGLNPLWTDSEFCGVSYEKQLDMLAQGMEILIDKGLIAEYFFAPSHTFDLNTVRALQQVGISRISDTIALKPYCRFGSAFVPQIGGKCREMTLGGTYTFCLHPNTMNERDFDELDSFLAAHRSSFIGFDEIDYSVVGKLDVLSRIIRVAYFLRRKILSPKK